MNRFKLTIAYDGAPFEGWQSQPGGNTVQDHVEAALAEVGGEAIRLHGSGRTDTGVHAVGQVAHFDAPPGRSMDAGSWMRALNTSLPPAIRVVGAREAPPDFHARFSASAKTYRYEIDATPVLHPHRASRAWHHPAPVDLEGLREACALFLGEHDFAASAANRRDGREPNTVRSISAVGVTRAGDTILIAFSGNGFLYRMVRLMVGGAMRVATDRDSLEWLRGLLENPGGGKCAHCAPAAGLYLVSVEYE